MRGPGSGFWEESRGGATRWCSSSCVSRPVANRGQKADQAHQAHAAPTEALCRRRGPDAREPSTPYRPVTARKPPAQECRFQGRSSKGKQGCSFVSRAGGCGMYGALPAEKNSSREQGQQGRSRGREGHGHGMSPTGAGDVRWHEKTGTSKQGQTRHGGGRGLHTYSGMNGNGVHGQEPGVNRASAAQLLPIGKRLTLGGVTGAAAGSGGIERIAGPLSGPCATSKTTSKRTAVLTADPSCTSVWHAHRQKIGRVQSGCGAAHAGLPPPPGLNATMQRGKGKATQCLWRAGWLHAPPSAVRPSET